MPDSKLDTQNPPTKPEPASNESSSGEPVAAAVAPTLGMGDSQYVFKEQQKNSKVLWGIFALLLTLVIGVIFILPKLVSPANAPEPTIVVVRAPESTTQNSAITPFQEAQILNQREDAQNVLAALLELQDMLEEKEVLRWAQAEMISAIEFATNGDEAYSQQVFQEAELYYLQGLEILQAVEASIPAKFTEYMEAGDAAILAGEPTQALEAFGIAFAITPASIEADEGYSRAEVLAEVLVLFEAGVALHENNLFEDARELYQQALAIDSLHVASQTSLAQANIDIVDRDFTGFMSQGYASIQAESPEQAEGYFRQALSLKPNSAQALAALEQSSDQITFNAITLRLDAAQAHVNAERWPEALSEYEQALVIDPNLVSALNGRNHSDSRNNLDLFLRNTIDQPLRLAEDSVYQQARRVYNQALSIDDRGPKLNGQLNEVNAVFNKIFQEISVSFISDGVTNVTLSRISALGQFTSFSRTLTPGTYTVVGVRDGFRDVREDFTVTIDGQVPLITIQCDEAI